MLFYLTQLGNIFYEILPFQKIDLTYICMFLDLITTFRTHAHLSLVVVKII
jgi:hypothetical protein